jgi:hypothetical protein
MRRIRSAAVIALPVGGLPRVGFGRCFLDAMIYRNTLR